MSSPFKIEFRPATRDDLMVLFEHETDPASATLAGVKPRSWEAFVAVWEGIFKDETVTERAILVDGAVAGRIACFERDGRAEIGYWIGRPYWGKGIATRALMALLEVEPRRPLHADVSASNPASARVLEKQGFIRISTQDEPETDRYLAGTVHSYRLD